MINLASVPTEALVAELETRPGIKKIDTGLYQGYSLRRTYVADPNERKDIHAKLLMIQEED